MNFRKGSFILTMACLVLSFSLINAKAEKAGIEVIISNQSELKMTHRAVEEVKKFFTDRGYFKVPNFKVVFKKEVYCEYYNDHLIKVYGYVNRSNPENPTVYMTTFGSYTGKSARFGVDTDMTMHESYLRHEIAHVLAETNAVKREKTLGAAVQEYIAYVVQISTLPRKYIERILEKNPNISFEEDFQINSINHSGSPDNFGVKAYKHSIKNPKFFNRILEREVDPDVLLSLF